MRKRLPLIALLGIFLPATAGAAPTRIDSDDRTYENCMRLSRTDPDAALEAALAWQDMGGGGAARHCVAATYFSLGQYEQAATRFEKLAGEMNDAPEPQRAAILAQAGTAWFRAEEMERAFAAQSAALELAPDDTEILIDRAMTLAGAKNYWEAIDDLNQVVARNPDRIEALVLRASAYRFVDAIPLAREDAEAAFRLAPERPEVLLEYGILQRLANDRDGARQSWLKLIRLHEGTPAADAAQRNLELLDVKVR
ncbi:MAG: tetratricopeptide repeat protein [Alphaproteobacteria bacterium]|nr:tetratricopeptide repeat protein [Alphaproteobacteria bacterium]